MSKRTCPTPWSYTPTGDSDGEVIGTDHFVLDADDNEVACPPTEEAARLIATAPKLLEMAEEYEKELAHIEYVLSCAHDNAAPELMNARRKLARVRDVLRKAKAKGEQ